MSIQLDAPISRTTCADTIYEELRGPLARIAMEFELREKSALAAEINRLKLEKGAVILGHNYMEPVLFHAVADIKGDSLELCREAARTDGDPIVFCGVRFMAETAKIINPQRTVLLPSPEAGCSLAASITGEDVRRLKQHYPEAPVVAYINTLADVKAEADFCCTSSNAAKIVESTGADTVIFVPDEFLARNVARETRREIVVVGRGDPTPPPRPGTRTIIGWHGRCEVHEKFTVDDVDCVRSQFPGVLVLAHPECSPEVVAASDCSASTSSMARFIRETDAPHYLLLTECSMGDNIAAANPQKDMLRLCSVRCPHMGEISLEQTLESLRRDRHAIEVPETTRVRARQAIDRMLAVRPGKSSR